MEIVAKAESGDAALDEIARHHPDLVLLDLQPVMSGLDVVSRLKCGEHMPDKRHRNCVRPICAADV